MVVLSMSKHTHKKKVVAADSEDDDDGDVEQTPPLNNNDDGDEKQKAGEKVSKEIMVIAQEVKIVQSLACNDLTKRNRQMRKLRKWLELRSRSSFPLTKENFMRIWKGLYYNMWMSDKPLVQEQLAEQLGQLLTCFDGNVALSVEFFGAFLHTMCQQWFGIDQWRMDKFLMLVRRMLRHMFRVLKATGWAVESVSLFNEHMNQTVLSEEVTAMGLVMHYLDIFFEELAKVSEGKINAEQLSFFIEPFVNFLGTQHNGKLISHCRTRVFHHLLYQSALGREYSEKYNAWKQMGFPTSSINDLERDDDSVVTDEDNDVYDDDGEDGASNKHSQLDPRAGDVDVFMPELPLDGKYVIAALEDLLFKRELKTKCRKMLKALVALFEQYQQGKFPLGVKTMPRFESTSEKPLMEEKIEQLENVENDLFGTDRKLKQLNKRKRRKLLKSLSFDNVDESNFEQTIEKALPKKYLLERRKRVQSALMNGWVEEDIEETEPAAKKKKKMKKSTVEVETKVKQNGDINNKILSNKVTEKSKKANTLKNNNGKKVEKQAINGTHTPISAPVSQQQQKSNASVVTVVKEEKRKSLWDMPLEKGEVEFFYASRRQQVKKANADLVRNPLAVSDKKKTASAVPTSFSSPNTPKTSKTFHHFATPNSSSSKRVKIALQHNKSQNPSEYLRQVKNSPDVPYDAQRRPTKGLLKPNAMPSPINPFYKKKIGLCLFNDTI